MPIEKIGIAFRSSVTPPGEILKFTKVADQSGFTHLFVNESSPLFDCLEICSAALAVSKGILVGSGVIRLLEHDEKDLLRRLHTMQELSDNRFVLGVGTGGISQNPAKTIESMLSKLDRLREDFSLGKFPSTFIATLKSGIARKVAGRSDGILLNFCLPEHAETVLGEYRKVSKSAEFACYLKVFYSHDIGRAKRLFVEEFEKYASFPAYLKMFEAQGILADIKQARQSLINGNPLPESLLRVSLLNPTADELKEYVSTFRKVGITLPCIYPYFASDDPFDFRMEKIRSILSVAG